MCRHLGYFQRSARGTVNYDCIDRTQLPTTSAGEGIYGTAHSVLTKNIFTIKFFPQIPVVPVGQELPQVVLDSKSANAIRWKSAIILHDETFGRDMVSHVIISLSQESPDGNIQPSAISMFKLSSKSHEWDRKREIRKTLRNLPIRSVGSNFIAVCTIKTMKTVMELAKDAGMVNVFTQWLYVVSDTNENLANFTEITHFIEEGDNIAIAYNMTRSDKSCVVSVLLEFP